MADSNTTYTYANTQANQLTTDFNISPYYDDYDARNNYYRTLFKPGYAVQARELTQMQTAMQKQVSRLGQHIFKEGSIVIPGTYFLKTNLGEKKGNPINYVKIRNVDTTNNTIDIATYDGATFTGATSNISAYVSDVLDTDGTTANTKTLYVTYLNAGTSNSAIRVFQPGETLTSNVGTAIVLSSDPVANTGYSSWFQIEEGVFYAKEHFIYFPTQKIVLDRYNPNPTCKVGFIVDEQIVGATSDASLLDPALEASNYSAPGADRLKIVSTLTVVPYDYDGSSDFVTLFTIKNGVLQSTSEKTQYNIIGDALATRTNEEAGDYVIRGLNVQINEHDRIDTPVYNNGRYANGNNQLLVVTVDSGYGYVKGYPVENYDRQDIEVEKPTNFRNVSTQISSTTMGQYVKVNEIVGTWQLDKGNRIKFYDVVQQRITNGGNTIGQKWSTGSQTGNNIGSAIYNTIEYVSGTPGYDAIYNIYLSDVTMNGANSFANVRSLYYDNTSTADMGADILGASNSSSNTNLLDQTKATLLYYVGSNYTKTVRDTSGNPQTAYFYNKTDGISSSLSIGTGGTFQVVYSGAANEYFPYGTTTLSDTDVLQDITLTLNETFNVGPLWTTATVAASGTTLIGSSTYFTRLNVGDKIEIAGQANTFYITAIANNTYMTLSGAPKSSVTGNNIFKAFKTGDLINMAGKGLDAGADRTVSATPTTLTFDLKETFSSARSITVSYKFATTQLPEAAKVLNDNRYVSINCASTGTSGPFNLGFSDVYRINKVVKKTGSKPSSITDGTDVTSFFRLDNGQRDTLYDLASIIKSNSLSVGATDYLLVCLDYFSPNFSSRGGFFTIDSYPIQDNDALSSNNTIRTENLPIFISPISGSKFDLRNYIDFRPIKTITANDATTVGAATTNPSNSSTTYTFSGTGMKFPVPSNELIYYYSYYLGRKDIVVVNKDANFAVVKGVPSETSITPEALDTQMLISILDIAPYPSLSPAYGNNLGRKDLACSSKKVTNRRYTMRDIGVLDTRIKSLEYYTSLTLLEKDALNLKILDDNGLDRFKNGIFIDTFKDTSLSAKGVDPDFRIVTDPVELCIRPLFSTHSLGYEYISGSGVTVHSDGVITLNYTEEEQYSQKRVTDTRNLERGTFFYEGQLLLFPKEDVWVDTSFATDETVAINVTDALIDVSVSAGVDTAAQVTKSLLNTVWEGWKTSITGYSIYSGNGLSPASYIGTYSTEEEARAVASQWTTSQGGGVATLQTNYNNTRIGINYFGNASTDTGAGGYKLISSESIPYIRPEEITCKALGLKPYSKMNVFFDDTNVSQYCTPLTSAQYSLAIAKQPLPIQGVSAQGSNLIVNNDGTLYFMLKLTANGPRFRTGDRRIVVMDGEQIAPQSVASELDASTIASAYFHADGTRQTLQRTVYSTKGYLKTSEGTSDQYYSSDVLVLPNTWTPPPPPKSHCCFDPNAKVLMENFTWKPIKDIVPGDRVVGHNNTVNTVSKNKTISVGIRKMIKFKGSEFYTTDDHIFLTKKGWKTWRPDIVLNSPDTSNGDYLIGENRERGIDNDDFLKKIEIVDGQLVEQFVPFESLEAQTYDFDPDYVVHDLTLDGNMTYIVEGFVVHNCCVAYTVLIRAPQGEEGVFISSFDIFVARKSATRGMWFEIREVNNAGGVTTTQIPNSQVYIENSSIVESTNGKDNPLNVKFNSPIFMFNNKEYAFIIHSFSPNNFAVDPDTTLWISRLGEVDKVTGAKVNERQNAGVFFQTNNNKLWEPVIDVDLTINIYRAKFTTGSQSFIIGNKPEEKMLLSSVSTGLKPVIGEYFTTGDTITLTGANGTIYAGNTIRGNVSTTNANSIVLSIPSAGKYTMANTQYRVGEKVDVYNGGSYAGVSATITAVANSTARLSDYVETSSLYYSEFTQSSGGFTANSQIVNMRNNGQQYRANVSYVNDFTYSAVSFEPKVLDFLKTDLGYEMSTYSNNSNSMGGYQSIHASDTYYFGDQKAMKSRSKEITDIAGDHSNKVRVSLSTVSDYVSPVFDINMSQTLLIDNLINANTSGETGIAGGQALNKYISQTITLADGQEAEDINIYLSAYRPPTTDIKVYVKFLQAEDSELLRQKNWIELEKDGSVYSSISDRFNYRELIYTLPASYMTGSMGQFQYTNGAGVKFTGYKYFAIKIVLTADNSALVPRVADLRCIALQI